MIMRHKLLLSLVALLLGSFVWAQEVLVQGTVTDNTGEPLPGVNILIKGTQKGTTTDFDGKYKIKAPTGSTLVFSYLGFKPKEITVKGAGVYNVTLVPGAETLNKVVITAMGIKKEEKALGYAVQEISTDNLKTPETDIFNAVKGEVSGVQISQTSGTPGAGVDILIRGITSIDPNQSNQPLVVVDGVPVDNSIDYGAILPSAGTNAPNAANQFSFANRGIDLNADDIAKITVLKGASATALYGVRGANGVILITTKRGKKGKPTFQFTSKVTTSQITKWFQPQTTWREGYKGKARATMDPNHPDVAAHQIRGYGPDKGVWLLEGAPYSFHTWGPRYSDDNDYTIRFHNIYKEFFRTGITLDNVFSVRGGQDKYNYYFSVGNVNSKSIVPFTNYNKTSFRIRGDYQISPKVNIELASNYIYTKFKLPNNGDKSIMSSMAYWSTSFPLDREWGPDGRSWNYTPYWIDNPRYFADLSGLNSELNRFLNSAKLKYVLTPELHLAVRGGVDTYTDARNRFVPPDLDVGTQVNGFVYNGVFRYRQLYGNAMLNYDKDLTSDIKLHMNVGSEVFADKRSSQSIRGEGLIIPDYNHISNTTNLYTYERTIRHRLVGTFAEMRLDLYDHLFLDVTGRNDWSSTFGKKYRSYFYPSASLAFNFNDFIDPDQKWFSFGKIRLSYGEVGKEARPGALGSFYRMVNNLPGGVPGTYHLVYIGDPNARPERQVTKEIGFDLRFFDNNLRIDYSYYDIHNKDLLFRVSVPNSSGLTSVYRNVGEMLNWGHELNVTAYWINNENFSWKTSFIYSQNKGKVLELDENISDGVTYASGTTPVIVNKVYEGDYLGSLYGYTWKYTEDGQLILDSRGRPQIDWSERKLVGNAFPDWVGSIGNTFSLKHVSFGFLVEYKKGGDVFDDFRRTATRNGNAKCTEERYVEKLWEGVQDDGNGNYVPNQTPAVLNEYWYRYARNTWATETQLEDGSWVKLRNLFVTYQVPRQWLSRTFIKGIRFNLSVGNVVLWSKNEGWDPEGSTYSAGSNSYGFIGYSTPLTTNYSFGLNVNL